MQNLLLTVGHSNHTIDVFVALLKNHSVSAIADVRSSPYSRFAPQFNREPLERTLLQEGIKYVFLGRELGARREEPHCYDGKKARYDLIAKSSLFKSGLERVMRGSTDHKIALMCSEKDPITCHRMVLVCRELKTTGLIMKHILEDGSLETTEEAEARMLDKTKIQKTDFYIPQSELINNAYNKQALDIAWVEPEKKLNNSQIEDFEGNE